MNDQEIKDRWREYFDKLFNVNYSQDVRNLIIPSEDLNRDILHRIRPFVVK